MKKRHSVVLAAGKGTRMKSDTYKVLHQINGITMVEHVLRAVQQAEVERIVTIVGFGAEKVQEIIGDQTEFALQAEQLGTGHAVLQAKDLLEKEQGNTLVICGDTPLLTAETLNQLFAMHEASEAKATILTAIAPDPTSYGRIVRDESGKVTAIVEQKDSTPAELAIQEINTGTYVFDNQLLFEMLAKVGNDNAQGEYYLPDVIKFLTQAEEFVEAFTMPNFDEALGINDRLALAQATELMTQRINQEHMRNGVTFTNPSSVYIEVDVEIGYDTIIEAGVSLKGHTKIGHHAIIGNQTEIINSLIGNLVEIKHSYICEAEVADKVTVGPFAHLRPETVIGEAAHIGNFVEVKNSTIAANTKAGHLSYIGDADIAENVNVGCGTIFANYDGKNKHRSFVGEDSFIGSGTTIVSPVNVGKQAVVAAGSTINHDVPDNGLAIARSRQENKDNYWQKFNNK